MTRRKRSHRPAPENPTTELIYGGHAVASALANPQRTCLRLWGTGNALERHEELIARAATPVEKVNPDALDRKLPSGSVHQGLVLEAEPLIQPGLEDLPGTGILVVLDQVTDPHNVGAVLRSCAAFGAAGLIMTDRNSPAQSGLVAKTASGAMEHVPLIRVTNLARALETIAAAGHQVIGLDGDAGRDISDLPPSNAIALVLGAEGKGLRRLTKEKCDHLARLETFGPMSSLNVSNAAAVALYVCSTKLCVQSASNTP